MDLTILKWIIIDPSHNIPELYKNPTGEFKRLANFM